MEGRRGEVVLRSEIAEGAIFLDLRVQRWQ